MSDTVERLLRETDWLRRFGRALVGADGDDLAQESAIVALRSSPDSTRPLRPWLAEVTRNLARRMGLRARNRRARDRAYVDASGVDSPSSETLLEQVALTRALSRAIEALAEPRRTILLLRHFEDLSSKEIGSRLGLAPGTVRWHLSHALEELRVALDTEVGGDRRRWVGVLLPIVAPPRPGEGSGSPPTRLWRFAAPRLVSGAAIVAGVGFLGFGVSSKRQLLPTTSVAHPRRAGERAPVWTADVTALPACQDQVKQLENDLIAWRDQLESRQLWIEPLEKSAPNERALATLRPLVEKLVAEAAAPFSPPPHELRCHGLTCQLTVIFSSTEWSTEMPRSIEVRLGKLRRRFASAINEGGRTSRDAIGGELIEQRVYGWRLAKPNGAEVTASDSPPAPDVPAPAVFADHAACEHERRELTARVAATKTEAERDFLLGNAFGAQPIDARLSLEVEAQVRRIVPSAKEHYAASVLCRGSICRVEPPWAGGVGPLPAARLRAESIGASRTMMPKLAADPGFASRFGPGQLAGAVVFYRMKADDGPLPIAGTAFLRQVDARFRVRPGSIACEDQFGSLDPITIAYAIKRTPSGPALDLEIDDAGTAVALRTCVVAEADRFVAEARIPRQTVEGTLTIGSPPEDDK